MALFPHLVESLDHAVDLRVVVQELAEADADEALVVQPFGHRAGARDVDDALARLR